LHEHRLQGLPPEAWRRGPIPQHQGKNQSTLPRPEARDGWEEWISRVLAGTLAGFKFLASKRGPTGL
jgi:hypothetical protein